MSQPEPGAVVDLLGVLAYAELTAFDRLAEDARLAPTLTGRAALARMAAAEIAHHVRLTERLAELGADPAAAMTPFTSALEVSNIDSGDWFATWVCNSTTRADSFRCRCTRESTMFNWAGVNGFSSTSSAPRRMASTAVVMVATAVKMTTKTVRATSSTPPSTAQRAFR